MNKGVLLLSLVIASQGALAQTAGVVRDGAGQPISNAVVEVVGANISVNANERGEFVLPDLTSTRGIELHVKAPQFMHKTFHLEGASAAPLELVLNRTVMDVINVVGLPWHASNMESAQPVNVLSGDQLRNRQAATLGDTLKYEVGVHSSYYGPVSSSPIIRGLEGPRVLITQNGLDAGDASRVGPDHAVAAEATTARQIEILRGPATLFYGSGAIGGVVNVVDDRVPQSTDTVGEWRVQHDNVADDKLASGSITTGAGNIAVHVDGFWRESDDYKIPGAAEVDHDDHDEEHAHTDDGRQRLNNSATEAKGLNIGASYLLDSGFIGLSVGRLERSYGIPGHSHGDEDVDVFADLEQDRVQLISEVTIDNEFFSAMNTRLGYTEYTHSEIEDGIALTTFNNRTREARVDLFHHPLADWRGALSVHYKHSSFEAIGEEAFTPPSETSTFALALMEERHFGDVLIQLGARVEQVKITADNLIVNLGDHGHDDHDHEHEEHAEELSVFTVQHKSTPFSLSVGAVWDFTPGYNLGLSLTHAQRTPSAAELLSFGPHIGSGMFEVGALLTVHQEDEDEFHFDLARIDVELERSNNLDISLRKVDGDVGFIVNAFYNSIDNYYYLTETGLTQEAGHDHDHGDEDGHDHGGEFPIFVYQASDANLYGFEGQFIWQLSDPLKVTVTTDYTRARLDGGGDLPRIPPMRVGGIIKYERDDYSFEFSALHHFEQDKIGAMETTTGDYTLLDLQFNYQLDQFVPGVTFYVQGKNLTNEYARVHSSFLKDKAPLPARSVAIGLSGRF